MGSIARGLAKLRNPLTALMGGVSRGYLEGLNWEYTAANTFTVGTGAAYCPYPSNPHVVVLNTPVAVTIPNGTPSSRVHLWLHDDSGTATVVYDESALSDNYYGSAYTHNTNKGWRYLGSVQRGTGGGVPAARCVGDRVFFQHSVVGALNELVSTAGQTAARTFSTDVIAPSSVISITGFFGCLGNNWRLAASASYVGFTVSNSLFTQVSNAPGGDMEVAVGPDRLIQYCSDAAGGSLVLRVHSYRFKR